MSETNDERIINLEIKQAFMERGLEDLDAVVRGLNLEVERLRKEVCRLQRQLSEEAPGAMRPRLEDEVPPHY